MRKGQSQIIEEVLLFGVGISVIAGLIIIFGNLNDNITNEIQEKQLREVNNYVVANILALNKLNCDRCSVIITIPREIGGDSYTILGSSAENKTIVYNTRKIWVEQATPLKLEGMVGSSTEEIKLEYYDGKIRMTGTSHY